MQRIFARLLGIIAFLASFSLVGAQASPQALRGFPLASVASFTIDYYAGYKVVTVKTPWPGAKDSYSYLLYKKGAAKPSPSVFPKALRVATPVSRVMCFSTSYVPSIVAIGETASIVGLDSAAWVYDPSVRARIASGAALEVTRNGMPDLEKIVSLTPDAIFTYGMGNEWDSHPKMVEAGLPVVIDGEWNESDPLARAEWSVFLAAFYDKEDQAEARFQKLQASYLDLKAKVAKAASRDPKVINSGPFQGTWYVSAGDSYMARLLADSGASYLWADTKGTGSLSLTVEAAYERAIAGDVWLNPAFGVKSIADVVALDRRFAELPAVKAGAVWNNDLRSNAVGGNDYFESAVIRPDEVLADLVAIFHPEILPGHNFVWYRKLDK